ncbi:unnamed protein product [Sphenostylis stenocarpa]|uniref:Uncharacterized protein n=1 Tax=Sphenostylis stenocarpa TaxID=92480 RepID=A0AA86S0C0_9FABA|nr:unnamed protein product [Sphenostylis stenocarpa]
MCWNSKLKTQAPCTSKQLQTRGNQGVKLVEDANNNNLQENYPWLWLGHESGSPHLVNLEDSDMGSQQLGRRIMKEYGATKQNVYS